MTTEKLAQTLPTLLDFEFVDKELIEVRKPTPWFTDEDGNLAVTTEETVITGDYYGEFTGGYPYIVESLENWAKANGGHWEWYNAAYFVFFRD